MRSREPWMAALLLAVLWPAAANAQFSAPSAGGIPGVGGAALGGDAAAAAVPSAAGLAAPAAPRTLWSFLGLSPTSLQNAKTGIHACRDKLCQSQFGQMLGSFTGGPMAGITGGFLPSLCPPAPSASQLSALEAQSGPEGAEAVAGKIKQSEADAKARVAAIEYLGTVDCNRWKEARIALINGLRADPNECVRYAAARVLNTGCCCSKPVIEALRVCVAGEDTDGNPPETSCRVKGAAFTALQNCLMRVPEDLPPERPPSTKERERERELERDYEIERERKSEREPESDREPMRGGPLSPLAPFLRAPVREGRRDDDREFHAKENIVTSHTTGDSRTQSVATRSQPKTFTQTVSEARRTLFQVAQNPTPPTTLPPGKRTLLHAFLKAKQDISTQQASAKQAESTADHEPPSVSTEHVVEGKPNAD